MVPREDEPMRIRDEEGHRAMQAAGKAWRAIKITSMRTWTDWTQVVGPGLMKAREEALSVSDSKAPIGSAYNKAMGALLQEYGFGDALERKRSEVTRADLLHCMDHLRARDEITESKEKNPAAGRNAGKESGVYA